MRQRQMLRPRKMHRHKLADPCLFPSSPHAEVLEAVAVAEVEDSDAASHPWVRSSIREHILFA